MSTIEAKLDDILEHPLRAAWSCGGGAWGYVGLDVPADLLGVPERVSCHLPWRKHANKPVATRWLETSFPGWAFSILEDWADGRFNCFEHVVFSRREDAAQRLYYYICELQRRGRVGGPKPLIFDIARIPRESSRRHTVAALGKLMHDLDISPEQLTSGLQRTNELREAFSGVQRRRTGPGRLYEKLVRASLFDDVGGLAASWPFDGLAQEAEGTVVLVGSTPPDDSLHTAVESTGWTVADERYDRSMYRLGAPVDPATADPVGSVARGWVDNPPQSIAPGLRDRKIDAAVLWFMREDESLAWRVPAQRAALEGAGIPTLVLTARSWNVDDGAVEETQSFLRGLR